MRVPFAYKNYIYLSSGAGLMNSEDWPTAWNLFTATTTAPTSALYTEDDER